MANKWIAVGAASGMIGVCLGAFGAHALAKRLPPDLLAIYHTAVQYQMIHVGALLAFGLWLRDAPPTAGIATTLPGWCFAAGTIVFSGSLYALALSGVRWLGAITPIGGTLFIFGWAAFAWSAWTGLRRQY